MLFYYLRHDWGVFIHVTYKAAKKKILTVVNRKNKELSKDIQFFGSYALTYISRIYYYLYTS